MSVCDAGDARRSAADRPRGGRRATLRLPEAKARVGVEERFACTGRGTDAAGVTERTRAGVTENADAGKDIAKRSRAKRQEYAPEVWKDPHDARERSDDGENARAAVSEQAMDTSSSKKTAGQSHGKTVDNQNTHPPPNQPENRVRAPRIRACNAHMTQPNAGARRRRPAMKERSADAGPRQQEKQKRPR